LTSTSIVAVLAAASASMAAASASGRRLGLPRLPISRARAMTSSAVRAMACGVSIVA
jgi:hypothetical protein